MDPIKVQYKFKTAQAKFDVDYDVCFNVVEKEIRLPGFHAPDDASVTWCLKITPEEACFEAPSFRFLNIDLSFESSIHEDLLIQPDLTARQTAKFSGDDYIKKHSPKGVSKDSFQASINWASVMWKRSTSLPAGKVAYINICANSLIINATIRYCEVSEVKDLYDVKGLPEEPSMRFAGEKCVLDGLASLLASGELADATLVVGGEELLAHRAILAAQSDVFKAMFSTACSEKDSGRVTIKDIDYTTMKELLRFLYTGSVDVDQDCLPALLVAADKYMVAGLRELCQRRLEKALRDDLRAATSDPEASSGAVLCGVLRASALLGSEPLRRLALDFLKSHMEAVVRTPAWAELVAEQRELAGAALVDAVTPPPPPAAAAEEQGTAGNKGDQKKKRKRRN